VIKNRVTNRYLGVNSLMSVKSRLQRPHETTDTYALPTNIHASYSAGACDNYSSVKQSSSRIQNQCMTCEFVRCSVLRLYAQERGLQDFLRNSILKSHDAAITQSKIDKNYLCSSTYVTAWSKTFSTRCARNVHRTTSVSSSSNV